jgi:hypothetical protein
MRIPKDRWEEASNGIVRDKRGELWRIIGFIDRPAVIMRAIDPEADRQELVMIMGSPISDGYEWLVPYREPNA